MLSRHSLPSSSVDPVRIFCKIPQVYAFFLYSLRRVRLPPLRQSTTLCQSYPVITDRLLFIILFEGSQFPSLYFAVYIFEDTRFLCVFHMLLCLHLQPREWLVGSSNSEGYAPCLSVDLLPGGKYYYCRDESKIKIIKISNSTEKQRKRYSIYNSFEKHIHTHQDN